MTQGVPRFSWLPVTGQRLFRLSPFTLLGDSVVKAGASRQRSVCVLVAAFQGDATVEYVAKRDTTESGLQRAALKLATATGNDTVVAELSGVSSEFPDPIWRSIAVVKAPTGNPLTPAGFDRYIRDLAERLGVIGAQEAGHLTREAFEWLDFEWETASGEQWATSRAGMASTFSGPRNSMIRAQQVSMTRALGGTIRDSHGRFVRTPAMRGTLGAATHLPDRRIATAMSQHHGFWVRDQYGRISQPLAAKARPIIERGLQQGLGHEQIGRELRAVMRGGLEMPNYWRVVAATATARSRSYALGASMQAAGISHYRVEAIRDEATTEICLMLHGRLIPVDGAMNRMNRSLKDPNPEGVLWHNPFISQDGDDLITETPDGVRTIIAHIESRGSGTGNPGSYSGVPSGNALVGDHAIGFPPYHAGGCRSTVIPEIA